MSASNQLVYGLTEKEAKDLESDAELVYGEMKEVSTCLCAQALEF